MMNKTQQFLKAHKIAASELDMQSMINDFIAEMKLGLEGKAGSLQMIPTYLGAEGKIKPNQPVTQGQADVHRLCGLCRHFFMHLPDNPDQLFKIPFVYTCVHS